MACSDNLTMEIYNPRISWALEISPVAEITSGPGFTKAYTITVTD